MSFGTTTVMRSDNKARKRITHTVVSQEMRFHHLRKYMCWESQGWYHSQVAVHIIYTHFDRVRLPCRIRELEGENL